MSQSIVPFQVVTKILQFQVPSTGDQLKLYLWVGNSKLRHELTIYINERDLLIWKKIVNTDNVDNISTCKDQWAKSKSSLLQWMICKLFEKE